MFMSFLQAGFDCTVGRNRLGQAIDHPNSTGHLQHAADDFRSLRRLGIRTVRDGVPWPLVECRPAHYDWSGLDRIIDAAQTQGMEVIFDLCHFGYPDGIDLYRQGFVEAFAAYCHEVALHLRCRTDGPCYLTPFNEPSYFAWAAGHAALFPPYSIGRAMDVKLQLAQAMCAGIDAIWRVMPWATVINVDPMCHVVAPLTASQACAEDACTFADVEKFNTGAVLEMWDMLCGNLYPEIGGSKRHLGMLGVNYYWTNQWELGLDTCLASDDPRRCSLQTLIELLSRRYGADLLLSETGHIENSRASWMHEVAFQAMGCLEKGIPLQGVCLYPILGMPSWHEPERWLRMGLWDVTPDLERRLHTPMAEALSDVGRRCEGWLHRERDADV